MTTMRQEQVKCSHCGVVSEQILLTSTNAFGSPDLDLRPPQMERSTIRYWVKQCPDCLRCASDLTKASGDMTLLQSPACLAVLAGPQPKLACWFLAVALLVEAEAPELAAISQLHAAWACDDAAPEFAGGCRIATLATLDKLRPFADAEAHQMTEKCIDMNRRAGRFAQAQADCTALPAQPDLQKVIRQVVVFQQKCMAAKDLARHTVKEATG